MQFLLMVVSEAQCPSLALVIAYMLRPRRWVRDRKACYATFLNEARCASSPGCEIFFLLKRFRNSHMRP